MEESQGFLSDDEIDSLDLDTARRCVRLQRDELRASINKQGMLCQLNDTQARTIDAYRERVEALPFDENDIRLIKEHVRLPPVTRLAVLEERVRCAMVCLAAGESSIGYRLLRVGEPAAETELAGSGLVSP